MSDTNLQASEPKGFKEEDFRIYPGPLGGAILDPGALFLQRGKGLLANATAVFEKILSIFHFLTH